jgi:hypothetical protein
VPETKPDRLYAIQCIDDLASLADNVRLETMLGLSTALAIPPWKSAHDRLNLALAKKLCDDQSDVKSDEADLLVGGHLEVWNKDDHTKRVLASIELSLARVARQRKNLATNANYRGGDEDDDRTRTLRDFCFETSEPSYFWVQDLARYIQARGLRITGAEKFRDQFICRRP